MRKVVLAVLLVSGLTVGNDLVRAQCPDLVGVWEYTFNYACAPNDPAVPLEETGYINGQSLVIVIMDQSGCLFRGYPVDEDTLGGVTNYFTGAIHASKSNVFVRAKEFIGSGQINKTATAVNNFIIQEDHSDEICAGKGKMTKTGPLP